MKPIVSRGRLMSRLAGCVVLLSLACRADNPPLGEAIFGPPGEIVRTALDSDGFVWKTTESPRVRLHVEKDSHADRDLEVLLSASEEALRRAAILVASAPYERGSHVFVVRSRERMQELIGLPVKGYCDASQDVAFVVYNEFTRPYLKHELTHLVSLNTWGTPNRWLSEGFAMYADGECLYYDNPLDTVASDLVRSGSLIPIGDLVDNFDAESARDDLTTYLQSGSLFKHIYEVYGVDAVKQLWQTGTDNAQSILGIGIEQLAQEWQKKLNEMPATKIDWEEMRSRGCG